MRSVYGLGVQCELGVFDPSGALWTSRGENVRSSLAAKRGDVILVMWVFTWKADETGKLAKANARLVDRGFSQRPRDNYNETFAPTPAAPGFRFMAAIVTAP